MAWSGWKLTWVLMRTLCTVSAVYLSLDYKEGEDKGNGTRLYDEVTDTGYLHLKP